MTFNYRITRREDDRWFIYDESERIQHSLERATEMLAVYRRNHSERAFRIEARVITEWEPLR